jgi:hypothetical protein
MKQNKRDRKNGQQKEIRKKASWEQILDWLRDKLLGWEEFRRDVGDID